MKLTEKTIDSEKIYEGKIITLCKDSVLLENGVNAIREVVHHKGAVCVVALNEKNEVYIVQQYRYPFKRVMLEIPAGKLDEGENPLDCAKRELLEETGVIAQNFISLGEYYPTPAYLDEIIHMFLATDLSLDGEQNLDDDEFLVAETVHIDKLVKKIISGEIKDGKTQSAILKTDYLLKNNKI